MKLGFLIFSFTLVFLSFILFTVASKENATFNSGSIIKYQTESDSFSACGINFVSPWFEIKDSQGKRILLVDSNGNLYIGSSKVYQSTYVGTGWKNAFIISLSDGTYKWAFNSSLAKIRGKIIENANPSYTNNSFIIINRSNNAILALFNGNTGDIIIRGKAAYQGAQAMCPPDYYYCSDNYTRAFKDYYCDISTGTCKYKVITTSCGIADSYCSYGRYLVIERYLCKNGQCTTDTGETYIDCYAYSPYSSCAPETLCRGTKYTCILGYCCCETGIIGI